MPEETYQRLARHLDDLPGGFPSTENGVELRILKRLFTEDEAELAMHLTVLAEPAGTIAKRAGICEEEAAGRLKEMALKGLIYRIYKEDEPRYMALQYVVGIWEVHVNDLDPDLIADMNEYLPDLIESEVWDKAPLLRTIPINQDIPVTHEILPHEQAQELVKSRTRIAVAPCICRREHTIAGNGCKHPEEMCLIFGRGAEYYIENGIGRAIDADEALDILRKAEQNGLVLQPSNSRNITSICCCCGCCCQVLLMIKRHPNPAQLVSSPFILSTDRSTCIGCGDCISRCHMDALSHKNELVSLDADRCIGCGLCVTTCPTGSLELVRKPEKEQKAVPQTQMKYLIHLAKVRGKLTPGNIAKIAMRAARR